MGMPEETTALRFIADRARAGGAFARSRSHCDGNARGRRSPRGRGLQAKRTQRRAINLGEPCRGGRASPVRLRGGVQVGAAGGGEREVPLQGEGRPQGDLCDRLFQSSWRGSARGDGSSDYFEAVGALREHGPDHGEGGAVRRGSPVDPDGGRY